MKIVNKIFFTLLSFFFASPAFAQADPAPLKLTGIDAIITKVLDIVFPVAGIACVVFIIIGGYMWIVSAGDPAKIKQAQGTLTWAIIGLVFILVATLIVRVVTDFIK